MRGVVLHGNLGERYGRRHSFDITNPAEAVRALCANFPGFERELVASGAAGVGYKVFIGSEQVMDPKQLHHPAGRQVVRIAPVLVGAGGGGKGGIGIFLGVALIAASFVPGLNVAVWAGAATTWSSIAFSVGFSLVLGGVAQLLTPTPKAPKANERPENTPSDFFDGPVNTTAQGQAVPVGYGRLIVGSAVISAGISVEEIGTTANDTSGATAWGKE